ncbi:unnamed protein product, partial [Didymodactylos carnosus]
DDIWYKRHCLLQPNIKYLEPSLSLRRTLLSLYEYKHKKNIYTHEISECWLQSARIARSANNSMAAIASLMKASNTHPIEVVIERAQWMWDKGEKDRAVMSLKQKRNEIFAINSNRTPAAATSITQNHPVSTDLKARLCLLLARYSEQNSPSELVIEMYTSVQELAPHWEEVHFYFGQYYDTLVSTTLDSDQSSTTTTSTTTTNNFLISSHLSTEKKINLFKYIKSTINGYCVSLKYGSEYIYQSLTRLLTMWLDFGTDVYALQLKTTTHSTRHVQTTHSNTDITLENLAKQTLKEINDIIIEWIKHVPLYIFLVSFPQLVSRICHSHKDVSIVLNQILLNVFMAYPHQTMWMMVNVYNSTHLARKEKCASIFSLAIKANSKLGKFIEDSQALTKRLDELCLKELEFGINKCSLQAHFKPLKRLVESSNFSQILIPLQSQMQVSLPPPSTTIGTHNSCEKTTTISSTNRRTSNSKKSTTNETNSTLVESKHEPFPNVPLYLQSFDDTVEVLSSLQKPKKIVLRGSDGQAYPFLCKSRDDLRVDSRFLEFCSIFNKCLKKHGESRRRQLYIRTYAVHPIHERCGLIEWIPNLCTFRTIVNKYYRQRGVDLTNRELKNLAADKTKTIAQKLDNFTQKLLKQHQPPVFHQYFFDIYPDPNRWYINRLNYSRTTAVISIIGYILGLGDRHCENILLDSCSGDTVHVDFNCLFNKGTTFEIPEKVPFRLTHNLVDGMGPLGVEGVYRKTCEITLHLIRDEKELLMSVLKTFVYDPLVEWKSSREQDTTATRKAIGGDGGEIVNSKNCQKCLDPCPGPRTAQLHVKNIMDRVRGFCIDTRNSKHIPLPLSVEGQVNHLIQEATDNHLLSQMFIGWAAYL